MFHWFYVNIFSFCLQIDSNLGDFQFLYVDLVITTTVAVLSKYKKERRKKDYAHMCRFSKPFLQDATGIWEKSNSPSWLNFHLRHLTKKIIKNTEVLNRFSPPSLQLKTTFWLFCQHNLCLAFTAIPISQPFPPSPGLESTQDIISNCCGYPMPLFAYHRVLLLVIFPVLISTLLHSFLVPFSKSLKLPYPYYFLVLGLLFQIKPR